MVTLLILAVLGVSSVVSSLELDRQTQLFRKAQERTGPIDVHVHLFGVGDDDSGCFISPFMQETPFVKAMKGTLASMAREGTIDATFRAFLVGHARGSGFARVVLLAQDGVYDERGELDRQRTHVYVPNDYLFEVVEEHSDLFLPCPSINPERKDRMAELDRCVGRGARLVKIHAPIQGVDVSAEKHRDFFARCAELGVVVLVHTGHEHSAPIVDVSLADPRRLHLALDEGCTVIACHCGTGRQGDQPDFLPAFLEMTRRYPRLYGDTSILGAPQRVRDALRLLSEDGARLRLLHGSDFPFPSSPLSFGQRLGWGRAASLELETNLLRRDLSLKAALGFPPTNLSDLSRILADARKHGDRLVAERRAR